MDTVRELTHRLLTDPTVRRVTDVCDTGMEQRTLQRLVPVLCRRHAALGAAARAVSTWPPSGSPTMPRPGEGPGWAELAADLGYADQAHFIRDFRRVLGQTPAAYASDLR